MANLDLAIGKLLSRLREMGLYDRTMIVLVSDHGEYFGEHMLTGHSKDVYQQAVRSALIIKNSHQEEGRVDDMPISSTDIPHMVLTQMSESKWKKYLSLFSYAPGGHPVISENNYSRAKDLNNKKWGERFKRVRTAFYQWPYKYIDSSDGCFELYDLESDPMESQNLFSENNEMARKMAATLKSFKEDRSREKRLTEDADSFVNPDEEMLDHLKELGYIK